MKIVLPLLMLFLTACSSSSSPTTKQETETKPNPAESWPVCDGFDFPVGPPDGKAYYNAQPFGRNLHLGDDWNGLGGGNTDLGDSVFSIGHGIVLEAEHMGRGWGNVLRIGHRMEKAHELAFVESLYAHLLEFEKQAGDTVQRGEYIGKIGNADGAYWAHLHLEIRDTVGLALGGGYSQDTEGYLDPTVFIKANRPGD